MPDQLQLRGGTTAEHSTFTGASKEVTVDTTKKTAVVHDGTTAGGIPLLRQDGSNSALALGSVGTPSLKWDANTGIYSPGEDQLAVATNGVERVEFGATEVVFNDTGVNYDFRIEGDTVDSLFFVDASTDRVGIGTATPSAILEVNGKTIVGSTSSNALEVFSNGDTEIGFSYATKGNIYAKIIGDITLASPLAGELAFQTATGGSLFERARIDSSGRLLVGTSTASTMFAGASANLQVQNTSTTLAIGIERSTNDTSGGFFAFRKTRSTSSNGVTVVQSGDGIGNIYFAATDGTAPITAASIEAYVDGTPGANDMPGRLVFSTNPGSPATSPTERMRITAGGDIHIGTQSTSSIYDQTSVFGVNIGKVGVIQIARNNDALLLINRIGGDGNLVLFSENGTLEGTISVSGTTVSLNGAHLSRWSQLPSGAERTEILRGTVLSNLNEMCEWGEEDNEQLNRMKVSDVESDKNVAGVFQGWDDDDDTYTNDFYCAMTGDFIIRIAEGVTVERGDLLMSAGDGTAKPQDDDIIRSKTIAKITSTNVSCTYEDGSYCVPCVLMAC